MQKNKIWNVATILALITIAVLTFLFINQRNAYATTKENEYNDEGMPYWDFYKALVIPGAYSVDKYYRIKNNWSWFENEQLNEQERENCLRLIEKYSKIDFLSRICYHRIKT